MNVYRDIMEIQKGVNRAWLIPRLWFVTVAPKAPCCHAEKTNAFVKYAELSIIIIFHNKLQIVIINNFCRPTLKDRDAIIVDRVHTTCQKTT